MNVANICAVQLNNTQIIDDVAGIWLFLRDEEVARDINLTAASTKYKQYNIGDKKHID